MEKRSRQLLEGIVLMSVNTKSVATNSDQNLLKNLGYGNYCVPYLIIKPLKLNFTTALIYAANHFIIDGNRCYLVLCPRISHLVPHTLPCLPIPILCTLCPRGGLMVGRVWGCQCSPLSLGDSMAQLLESSPPVTLPSWALHTHIFSFFLPWCEDHRD